MLIRSYLPSTRPTVIVRGILVKIFSPARTASILVIERGYSNLKKRDVFFFFFLSLPLSRSASLSRRQHACHLALSQQHVHATHAESRPSFPFLPYFPPHPLLHMPPALFCPAPGTSYHKGMRKTWHLPQIQLRLRRHRQHHQQHQRSLQRQRQRQLQRQLLHQQSMQTEEVLP